MSQTELMIVLVLSLVLIGPDELPAMTQKLGKTIGKTRTPHDPVDLLLAAAITLTTAAHLLALALKAFP